ncbi:cell division protein FtsN [Canicola haemoglobinophilus]|uniref:Cell division protein FtsN n=1 Tax=Canicola haemoglobinophilus TaxID=733 RepID=A0AB38H8R0_9PAST|nr:cell division protein FtsN [Canicola haemoglobinophilus]STO67947.1 cell division protein FtsN [Canicola haemoglobinophilus]
MAKDYIANTNSKKKKKQKKGQSKILLISLVLLIILGFAAGLYFLKTKTKNTTTQVSAKPEKPKSVLPTPPEEVWSYIKALETRTVPVDNNAKSLEKDMRLSEEQKKILLEMEKEQKAAEQARINQIEERKKIEEQKAKEDKLPKSTVTTDKPKVEVNKIEKKAEVVTAKPTQSVQTTQNKPSTNSSEKKFGLQCGAFKNRAQAENMQARLSMAGFNARVNSSEDWNRVVVGPVGDRSATKATLDKAKSIGNCVIIGM